MFDKIVVAVCVVICVVAGIWGWWLENGPEKKDDQRADQKSKDNKEEKKSKE